MHKKVHLVCVLIAMMMSASHVAASEAIADALKQMGFPLDRLVGVAYLKCDPQGQTIKVLKPISIAAFTDMLKSATLSSDRGEAPQYCIVVLKGSMSEDQKLRLFVDKTGRVWMDSTQHRAEVWSNAKLRDALENLDKSK